MDINIWGTEIIINFTTTEAFAKEAFINGYRKNFNLITKAAEYLGCTCNYQFNEMKE